MSESDVSNQPVDPVHGGDPEPEHEEHVSTETAAELPPQPYVAKYGRYYRNTRYIMAALFIGLGLWFAYDGFVGYPEENARLREIESELLDAEPDSAEYNQLVREKNELGTEHSDTDIFLQKLLGFTLPPIGILLVAWAVYNSRGRVRLEDDVLHVPGHPAVPIDRITSVDQRLWDRKGIAYCNYALDGGEQGRLRLDDFVYERKPIDHIYDHIVDYLGLEPAKTSSETSSEEEDDTDQTT